MTQLERELKRELELQRELFNQELKSVTTSYESNLDKVMKQYENIVARQQNIMEQQSHLLERYSNVTSDIKVSLDSEPVRQLQNSHKSLIERLDALERSDEHLLGQLNEVLRKL